MDPIQQTEPEIVEEYVKARKAVAHAQQDLNDAHLKVGRAGDVLNKANADLSAADAKLRAIHSPPLDVHA